MLCRSLKEKWQGNEEKQSKSHPHKLRNGSTEVTKQINGVLGKMKSELISEKTTEMLTIMKHMLIYLGKNHRYRDCSLKSWKERFLKIAKDHMKSTQQVLDDAKTNVRCIRFNEKAGYDRNGIKNHIHRWHDRNFPLQGKSVWHKDKWDIKFPVIII